MTTRLAKSAGLISAATMTSRVLGVAREVVLAARFGAGDAMDAFNIAFRIPNLLRDLFAEGALTAAFVPTFARRLSRRGRDEAWRLGNLVINALLLITGAFVVAGFVLAGPITHLFASEYAMVPGKLELTTLLARMMMPFLTLVAVSVAVMGMLNSLHRFFVPALSPAMFNVAMIVSVFAVVPVMPWIGLPPVAGIAIGALAGGLGQIAVQWPVLHREGFRYRPVLDFQDEALRDVLSLMGPGALGLAAVQINVFVNSWIATSLGSGAVSWLNYSFRLMYLPIGLFGVAIGTAALPDISRAAAEQDLAAMRNTVSSALRMMLMLNVPATIGLIALAHPIVRLLLERGNFQPADTAATAAAVIFYAPGLLGYSAVKVASPSFYALRDNRTPVATSVLAVAVNFGLNLLLARMLGHRGLALGTAIAALVNAAVLLWLLGDRLGGLDGRRMATAFVKITAASLAMGATAVATERWLETIMAGGDVLFQMIRLFTSIGAAVLVLGLVARVLRIDEFQQAVQQLRRVARRG